MEGSFHAEYGIDDLMGELGRRTWRWFTVRIATLSAESSWAHALWPVDPTTGKRSRRESVTVLDDEGAVEAFFARQAV